MKRIIKWLDGLSSKAILNRLDKRKQLEEQDLKRIFPLLTEGADGDRKIDAEEIRQVVKERLHDRLYSVASVLHQFLDERNDVVPFVGQASPLPDSVIFPEDMAMEIDPAKASDDDVRLPTFKPKVSLSEVSALFQERLGYTLQVFDSSISHPEAGNGLWLSGTASTGDLVGLFPGVSYEPIYYREMVGYPRVDQDNPYLISRYDGVIIDSKAWGFGPYDGRTFAGTTQTFAEVYELEGRHPLAFAHFANHPPKGTSPNVLLAPFDIRTTSTSRPYIPNVKCVGPYAIMEPNEAVAGLALLASRPMQDEEIFVNYRLSPLMPRPEWYHSVDENEDHMRWS